MYFGKAGWECHMTVIDLCPRARSFSVASPLYKTAFGQGLTFVTQHDRNSTCVSSGRLTTQALPTHKRLFAPRTAYKAIALKDCVAASQTPMPCCDAVGRPHAIAESAAPSGSYPYIYKGRVSTSTLASFSHHCMVGPAELQQIG